MENVLGTNVEVRREDVRTWLTAVVPAYAAHALGAVAVTWAIGARSIGWLVVMGVYVALATIVLDATLRRRRSLQGPAAILLRAGVAVVQLAVGVVLVGFVDGEAFRFMGLTSLALFASSVLSEVRYSTFWTHVRARVVLGVAVLLALLGLWPIGDIDPIAGVALAGFGGLAAVLGGELVTEDWLRGLPRWDPGAQRLIGLAVVVAAAGVLIAAGASPVWIAVLSAVLLVLVMTVSSDGDSAEVVVLLTIALVWAAAPRDVAPPAATRPQAGDPFFVALGDSYISGEGAERYLEGTNDKQANECRRAPTAHPVVLARAGGPEIPDRVLFLACSGALSVDLYGDRLGRTEPEPQLDQLERAIDGNGLDRDDLAFVLLSIGGNDAGFGEVGQACVAPGSCEEIGTRWLERLEDVRTKLERAYDEVESAVGDVPVHVVPYPMPLADHGCWWSWLTPREVRFLTGFVRELNTVIAAEAAEHGFDVVETMETTFATRDLRICDRSWPSDLGMNFIAMNPTSGSLDDIVNPRNWIHNSFHPNEVGHAAMAETIERWLTAPSPGAMERLEEVADPIALPCPVDDPPRQCLQRTSHWQGIQVLDLLRAAFAPIVLLLMGCWLLVAPSLRWASETGFSVSRYVLRALSAVQRALLRRLGRTPGTPTSAADQVRSDELE